MSVLRPAALLLLLLLVALLAPGSAAAAAETRYSLAQGCFSLAGEAYRFQPTALGRYQLYGTDERFLVATGDGRVRRSAAPSGDGDWRVAEAGGGAFTLTVHESGQRLARTASGALRAVANGPATAFAVRRAQGCSTPPEAEVNVEGTPYRGPTPFGHVKGLIETHLHGMAFEFLGGSVHCGRPWHPQGITVALVDCPDHAAGGRGAALENTQASGNPVSGHHTDGWPSFEGWPHHRTYTHEQVYYKWLERAWRGGLRLYTNLLVDNEVLCEVYPLKRNPCNEMHNVRLQHKRLLEMIDYIDAQSGGPGKGWLRIVRDPFEAREVINAGKLAVVIGIETSKLFDCGEYNHTPLCTKEQIDAQLDDVHRLGVRQMEFVNKLDNALVGVAGDAGTTGILTNSANKQDTGHFWAMQTCTGPNALHDHDEPQITTPPQGARDELVGAVLAAAAPPDATPVYPPAPHCNQQGLTDLGAHLVRRMIEKGMLLDPDHMSVVGRDQALAIVEAADYGGVLSSHSWSTPDSYRRILALGGLVTPAPKTSEGFVRDWKALKAARNPRFLYGTGFSTDMNGFAAQGGPRKGNEDDPVVYPFTSLDGSTTLERQRTGTRTFDLNTDGTAHFGLYPDRIEDIRIIGGEEVAQDLVDGAEAYLQMWERAAGVPGPTCRSAQRRFLADGLGEIRIGMTPERLLRSAGQPATRPGARGAGASAARRAARSTRY